MSEVLLDRAGRRRSPATLPGFHAGQAPGNEGLRYPADPPKVEEIVAIVIQRQLGHSNLGITSVYLQGIDSGEIIETVHVGR
jgi:hypothetical protein